MFNLDPGKLLVIAVVAIILLGPDRLPQVARQVGGAWRSFNEFRHRMECEVRSTMPDLPPTSEIARLARSPSALLNHLSKMSRTKTEEEPDGPSSRPTSASTERRGGRRDQRCGGDPAAVGAATSERGRLPPTRAGELDAATDGRATGSDGSRVDAACSPRPRQR